MKRKLLATIVSTITLMGSALGSTVSVSDFSGSGATFAENLVLGTNLARLGNGLATIRLGYFSGGMDTNLANALSNPDKAIVTAAIAGRFVPLGEGGPPTLGTSAPASAPRINQRTVAGSSQAGRLLGQVTLVTPTAGAANAIDAGGVPAGTRLYLMVYNDAVAASATELGIFSADTWLMPANNLSNLTMNSVDVNTDLEVFRGARGSLILAPLTVIPEPSTGIMALLAGLGLIARRRR